MYGLQIRNPLRSYVALCALCRLSLIGPVRLKSTHILSAGDTSCQSNSIFITSSRSCITVSQDKPGHRQVLHCDHALSIDIFSDAIILTGLDSAGF